MLLDLGGAQRVVSLGLAGPARVRSDASRAVEARTELLRQFFGCGRIVEQQRRDDHRHLLLRFSVKRRADLVRVIVPFFKEHPLITAKRLDFQRFCSVLQMMEAGEQLTESGLRRIASVTETMNRMQRSRFLESSEAIRQPPRTTPR